MNGYSAKFRADIVAEAAGGTFIRLEFGIRIAVFIEMRTHGDTIFRASFYADSATFAVLCNDSNAVHHHLPEHAVVLLAEAG